MPDTKGAPPPAYTVVEDKPGCETCGYGKTWSVVGPGEIAESVSYHDEEDAQAQAGALNEAFWQGQQSKAAG